MNEQPNKLKNLQWKWVGITFAFYLIFYCLPISFGMRSLQSKTSPIGPVAIGAWVFAGIIIVAAVARFISKGVTLAVSALACIMMMIFWIIIFSLFVSGRSFDITRDTLPTAAIVLVVFMLSLLDAWLGDRAHKLWTKDKSQAA